MIKCERWAMVSATIVPKRERFPWLKTFQKGFVKGGVTEQALIKHAKGKRGKESGDNPC